MNIVPFFEQQQKKRFNCRNYLAYNWNIQWSVISKYITIRTISHYQLDLVTWKVKWKNTCHECVHSTKSKTAGVLCSYPPWTSSSLWTFTTSFKNKYLRVVEFLKSTVQQELLEKMGTRSFNQSRKWLQRLMRQFSGNNNNNLDNLFCEIYFECVSQNFPL